MINHNRMKQTKTWTVGLVLGALPFLAGCADYKSNLQANPACVQQAQISQIDIDACIHSSSRADFASCLALRGVPQYKIKYQEACLNPHQSPIGSIFY
jgi:hypothetical protein